MIILVLTHSNLCYSVNTCNIPIDIDAATDVWDCEGSQARRRWLLKSVALWETILLRDWNGQLLPRPLETRSAILAFTVDRFGSFTYSFHYYFRRRQSLMRNCVAGVWCTPCRLLQLRREHSDYCRLIRKWVPILVFFIAVLVLVTFVVPLVFGTLMFCNAKKQQQGFALRYMAQWERLVMSEFN